MKFFLNAILAIIILSAGLFGLHKTGIIIFNTPIDSVLSGAIEGTISDMPIEEDNTDLTKEIGDDSAGVIEEEQKVNYLTVPYPETAEIGTFTELGKISANTTLYSYKVKLGGTIGGVENKWEDFAKGANLNGKKTYTNDNGNSLSTDVRLNAGEIVYVELNTTSAQITQTPGTTTATVGSNDTATTIIKPSQAKTCVKYTEFFECMLSKVSGVDPDIMRNNLNAFMNAISILSINDQEAKCTNLIYEIKSKSASTANQACVDIIK